MPPGARHIRPAFYCASWQYPPTLCRSRTADNRIDNERQLRSRACLQNGITPTIVTLLFLCLFDLAVFSRYSFLDYTILPHSSSRAPKILQKITVVAGSVPRWINGPAVIVLSHKATGALPRWKWPRRTRHRDINHTPYYRATRSRRVDSQPSFPLRDALFLPSSRVPLPVSTRACLLSSRAAVSTCFYLCRLVPPHPPSPLSMP